VGYYQTVETDTNWRT